MASEQTALPALTQSQFDLCHFAAARAVKRLNDSARQLLCCIKSSKYSHTEASLPV